MSAPKRIRLSRAKGWRIPEGAVKVDRSTALGNPFIVGTHGDAAECVYLFRMLLTGYLPVAKGLSFDDLRMKYRAISDRFEALRGKDLACWCALDKPCHADVLLDLANAPTVTDFFEGNRKAIQAHLAAHGVRGSSEGETK